MFSKVWHYKIVSASTTTPLDEEALNLHCPLHMKTPEVVKNLLKKTCQVGEKHDIEAADTVTTAILLSRGIHPDHFQWDQNYFSILRIILIQGLCKQEEWLALVIARPIICRYEDYVPAFTLTVHAAGDIMLRLRNGAESIGCELEDILEMRLRTPLQTAHLLN
ncbi:MAG: hypothetical protein V4664_01530 [Patescibacteria group bacterium]